LRAKLLSLLDNGLLRQIIQRLEQGEAGGKDLLRVLTYHRVDEKNSNPELSPSILSASPKAFEEQMRFIKEAYKPVALADVLAAFRGEASLPEGAILVTFDDAYCDFKEQAWPILKALAIPAVLFVPTKFVGHPERLFWWDKVYNALQKTPKKALEIDGLSLNLEDAAQKRKVFKELRNHIKSLVHADAMNFVERLCEALELDSNYQNKIMTWDEIRALVKEGLIVGAHTQNHPLLNRLSVEEAVKEASNSLNDLREQLGEVLPSFAYPSGGANRELADALAAAGFELAFTTERGINSISTEHPLLIKRFNIGFSTPLTVLRLQLFRSFAKII
jgi:peptidoglycan/xylan/chitin deacetylase (PgdA/CDA1 family)